jgi:hypothetical protein
MNLTEEALRAAMERAIRAVEPEVRYYACDINIPKGQVFYLAPQGAPEGQGVHVIHPDDLAQIVRETAGAARWVHVREMLSAAERQVRP